MANFLLCFSVIKNTKAVLNTDVPKGSITSINGMRTLSITWVVLGHALFFALQFIGRYESRKIPATELFFFSMKTFSVKRLFSKQSFLQDSVNFISDRDQKIKKKPASQVFSFTFSVIFRNNVLYSFSVHPEYIRNATKVLDEDEEY